MTHEPVLLQEVMGFLAPLSEREDGARVFDGTLGLGGYELLYTSIILPIENVGTYVTK